MVFFLISVLILIFLLYFKQYKTPLQRLFLFLTIMTVIHEAGLSIAIERRFYYPKQEQFCEILGFFNQCIGTILRMLTAQIAMYVLHIVYKELKGTPFPKIAQNHCLCRFIESIYLFAPTALVIIETGYPYIGGGKYGFTIADCWIQAMDKDCNKTGFKYQVAAYLVDAGLVTIGVIATLVLAVVYCRMAYVYRKTEYSKILLLVQQTLILMGFLVFPLFQFVVGVFRWHYIYSFPIAIIDAIDIPLCPVLPPIGYLVYIYATRSTHSQWRCCKCTTLLRRFKQTKSSKRSGRDNWQQPPITDVHFKTNPSSHPQYYPSATYFDVEPTGGFPSHDSNNVPNTIQNNQQWLKRVKESETNEGQPLLNSFDTGYNTMS